LKAELTGHAERVRESSSLRMGVDRMLECECKL
jgi:hypothetical protein